MPTAVSISTARALASAFETLRCRLTASISCAPILCTGFSDVIGSWKIIAASLPRTWRSSDLERLIRSRPSSIALPVIRTFLPGRSPISVRLVTDLPEPDSPTMPSTLPRSTENET